MYFAIDLILVALMAAVIFNAVRRGFIVSVFRLLSTVVSVAAAAIFYKDLGLVFTIILCMIRSAVILAV